MSKVSPEKNMAILKKKKRRRRRRRRKKKQTFLHLTKKKLQLLIVSLGYSIGMSNVWRFPYLCYTYGGGAFLLPYIFLLLVAGVPLVALESAVGQYSSFGPEKLYGEMCPFFKGLGFAMLYILCLTAIWYNMILAWSLYYLFVSVVNYLPWTECGNPWNTPACYNNQKDEICKSKHLVYYSNKCIKSNEFCNLFKLSGHNESACFNESSHKLVMMNSLVKRISSSEQYYRDYILKLGDDILDFDRVDPMLILWLCISWFLVWICVVVRFQLKGKLNYITAVIPYICMLVLLIRMMMLEGSETGLEYYLVPKFKLLTSSEVWGKAASQICFSLGPGFGGVITKCSFQKFSNDFLRDTFLSAFIDTGTSLVGGIMIFAIVGFMAKTSDVNVDEVVTEGTWIAFTTLPEAVENFGKEAWFWSVAIFAFMVISLGFDTQFTCMDTIMAALVDKWPFLDKWKNCIMFGCSIIFCICGISMTGRNGAYLFRVFDEYITGWTLVCLALIENIIILWIYNRSSGSKIQRFYEDVAEMSGNFPTPFWRFCWKYLTPVILIFVLVFCWLDNDPILVSDYTIPWWAMICGHCLAASPLFFIICVAALQLIITKKKGLPFATLFYPTSEWKPAKDHRKKSMIHDLELDDVLSN